MVRGGNCVSWAKTGNKRVFASGKKNLIPPRTGRNCLQGRDTVMNWNRLALIFSQESLFVMTAVPLQ